MYLQGCRAARRSFHAKIIDLDIVRAQTLTAAYLMQLELLLAASHTISVASQLAASLRLNNENSWPKLCPADVLMRKRLWWTIFFIDRRVAQKCGAAYHIQDSEFCISDFKDNTSSMDCAYLQVNINLARLWGQIWDSLFAVGAITKSEDEVRLTVEIMDTHILNARRQIPLGLTWDPSKLTDGAVSSDSLQHLQRCLYLYTVRKNSNFILLPQTNSSILAIGAVAHANPPESIATRSLQPTDCTFLCTPGMRGNKSTLHLHC
jgi:hypothetical protein